MFGIDSSELFVIGLVALLVMGPQRLPLAMRTVGQWVAKGRSMTRHLRTGFDTMVREAELEEMQNAWAKQNEAIIQATALDPTAYLEPLGPNADLSVPVAPDTLPEPVAGDEMLPLAAPESAAESVPASKPKARKAAEPAGDGGAPARPARKRTPKASRDDG